MLQQRQFFSPLILCDSNIYEVINKLLKGDTMIFREIVYTLRPLSYATVKLLMALTRFGRRFANSKLDFSALWDETNPFLQVHFVTLLLQS
jgi:hypothetical protein